MKAIRFLIFRLVSIFNKRGGDDISWNIERARNLFGVYLLFTYVNLYILLSIIFNIKLSPLYKIFGLPKKYDRGYSVIFIIITMYIYIKIFNKIYSNFKELEKEFSNLSKKQKLIADILIILLLPFLMFLFIYLNVLHSHFVK